MSLAEILETRKEIILKGKRLPAFAKLAKRKVAANKKRKEKYCNLDNVEDSGSINDVDCAILYSIVQKYKPKKILELGTWFGVSAMTMDKAMEWDGEVHTIDKNKLFAYSGRVTAYNGISSDVLKMLQSYQKNFDLVFVDATMFEKDEKRIQRLMKESYVFITHDYEGDEKGVRNVKRMRNIYKDVPLETFKNSTIALMEIK